MNFKFHLAKSNVKIKTPDQRLRVFVSSTLRELSEERKAVRSAIETIHMIPVMFELGARPHPPRDLYQAYLEQSQIFIGIYWQSYGWIAENEKISGLEDELLLSEKFPRLIYVKEPAPEREEKLNLMLDHIRSKGNVSYKSFSTTGELKDFIENDLAILISERFYSETDPRDKIVKKIHNNLAANLPRLIGREKEISEIADLICNKDAHLITITGPGGIGKTRLSQQIGKTLSDYYEDGIYFCDLSGVFDESNLFRELAKVFGISLNSSMDKAIQLSEFICDKKILLIIDNFEQLTNAGTNISAIVTRCPELTVIVTSRNPLDLSVETEYSIDALSFPDPEKINELSEIEMSPSVMLFTQGARSVYRNFELTGNNIRTIADICWLLGGIPLAIELAAAKVRIFSLETIREKLTKKIDLLSGGKKDAPERHKTMKATLEWSYDLLNEEEKKLFRRLSVFINGFDFYAIEKICCYDMSDPYETIDSLYKKKFFKEEREVKDAPRFNMLELLRKFSAELFEISGEEETVKNILTEYYMNKAQEESSRFYGAIEAIINSEWHIDIQNVMTAIEQLYIQKKYKDLIEMIYSLWPVFYIFDHDNLLEKRIDLKEVLNYSEYKSDDITGKLNWLRASAAMESGDLETAAEKFKTAYQFFTLTNNTRGIAWTNLLLNSFKSDSVNENSYNEIRREYIYSAELFRKCKDRWGESVAMQYSAAFEMSTGNYNKAVELYDICAKLLKDMKSSSLKGYMLSMKALAYIEMKQYEKASVLVKEASKILNDGFFDEGTAYSVLIIAYYFFRTNDNNNGMLFAGFSKNVFSKYSYVPWHMLSYIFTYVDEKVKDLNEGPLAEEFQKGTDLNVFKVMDVVCNVFQDQ